MEGVFAEFENENGLRSYPFAGACAAAGAIPDGLFVDAMLYPVNSRGSLYLSGVSEEGVVSISDGNGVVMTCDAPSGRTLEFRDVTPFARHVGTMVAASAKALAEFVGRRIPMSFTPLQTTFAASCTFPVAVDGVTSMDVGGTGPVTGRISFSNGLRDDVRVSTRTLEDGRQTLRFDVVPTASSAGMGSIRKIRCVVDGKTPFRIARLSDDTVALYLSDIDREVVCSSAHRENSYEMADTCKCNPHDIDPVDPPSVFQEVEIDVSSAGTNAFYLVAPNFTGYSNPISITLQDGLSVPKVVGPDFVKDGENIDLPAEELLDDVSSKGIVLQVPGLSGGQI